MFRLSKKTPIFGVFFILYINASLIYNLQL
uniref:Uncharacterized protein n=1 Tax=Myoviridae sp. ctj994 TaxID=2825160 RepID=A0A8S5NYF3_9CAUD|nr:MAG TPA: hypothetical protein [Myoviridae sp. ctj994]DAR67868.1 MAG TPA: hypothetical protein [Caudoviricetes sp.]DAS09901.1 MAG TPA: hypothetical protein [Caudoviricetes sp.]